MAKEKEKFFYVLSTASNATAYGNYKEKTKDGVNRLGNRIIINGGANVVDKNLITRKGVLTKITAEQMDQLKKDPKFQKHVDAKYLRVLESKEEIEAAVIGMKGRDEASPLVPEDFEPNKAPTTGAGAAKSTGTAGQTAAAVAAAAK